MSRRLNVALWSVQVLLCLGFLISGFMSLAGAQMKVRDFDLIGWGQWFRYVTGAMEVSSAILIVMPRFTRIAAGLLICVMIGATVANLTVSGMKDYASPPILLLMAAFVFWGRRRRISL